MTIAPNRLLARRDAPAAALPAALLPASLSPAVAGPRRTTQPPARQRLAALQAPAMAADLAADDAAVQALCLSPSPAVDEPPQAAAGCGWFESSWELGQGLVVSEWAESDPVVLALWFPHCRLQ